MAFITKHYLEINRKLEEMDITIEGVNQLNESICLFATMTFIYHMLTSKFKTYSKKVITQSAQDVITEATERFKCFRYIEKKENKDKLDALKKNFLRYNIWLFTLYKKDQDKNEFVNIGITIDPENIQDNFNLYFPEMIFIKSIYHEPFSGASWDTVTTTYKIREDYNLAIYNLDDFYAYINDEEFNAGIFNYMSSYFGVVKKDGLFYLFDSHAGTGNGAIFTVYRDGKALINIHLKKMINWELVNEPIDQDKNTLYVVELTPLKLRDPLP